MKPQTIGRFLGVGVRVAGRMAGQRMAASAQAEAAKPAADPVARAAQAGAAAGKVTRAAGRGMGGFVRPFTRVGGILWLEVTGAFFLLFALVFASFVWKLRASLAHGPDHNRVLGEAAMAVVFLYLGLSSFWRARRR